MLGAWQVSPDLRVAGMFHSIYATDQFRKAILPLSKRAWLQARIGTAAERLAYLFGVLRRESLFECADTCISLSADVFVELPCHWSDNVLLPVAGSEIASLLLLHLANLIEQAAKPVTGIGFWLAFVSRSAASLRAAGVTLPPVLRGIGSVSLRDEGKLQSLYTQALTFLESGEITKAIELLTQACAEFGVVGEPYVMLAVANRWVGNVEAAKVAASKGRDLLQSWGSPWHKRLSLASWFRVCNRVVSASTEEVRDTLDGVFGKADQNEFEGNNTLGAAAGTQLSIPSAEAAARFFSFLHGIHDTGSSSWYPGLQRAAWHDPRHFDVVAELEERFAEVKAEAINLPAKLFHDEAEEIGRTGSWQVAMLFEQGRRNEMVCARCPTVTSILERHPCVRRSAGLIYISRIGPQTHVVAHQGNSNVRLRCHLGISIPAGDCAIRVGSETRRWEEGKCIVLDDTFEHEVWNRTSRDRIILLIDLWHPGLTDCEREGLEAINRLTLFRANLMTATWRTNNTGRGPERKREKTATEDERLVENSPSSSPCKTELKPVPAFESLFWRP